MYLKTCDLVSASGVSHQGVSVVAASAIGRSGAKPAGDATAHQHSCTSPREVFGARLMERHLNKANIRLGWGVGARL